MAVKHKLNDAACSKSYSSPVLLEIGRESVLGGTADDELLDMAAQELIDEATRLS